MRVCARRDESSKYPTKLLKIVKGGRLSSAKPPEWWVLPSQLLFIQRQHHTELCKQESMAFIAPSIGPGAAGAEAWRTAVHPRWVPIWWSPQQQRRQERLSCTPAHERRTTFAPRPSAKSSTMAASDQDDGMGAAGVHTPPRRRSLGPEVAAPTSGADPAGQGELVVARLQFAQGDM